MKKKRFWAGALFFSAAVLLLFWNLHRVPLFDPDEGRYADMSLEMIQTGDWLVPHMNHIVHLHKPPVINWFIAGAIQLFGPGEFAARFPSVLASLMLLGAVMAFGKFVFDFRSGYHAAWILLTSALYLAVSRLATTDMLLTFLTSLSMMGIAYLFWGKHYKILCFYGIALGLAFGMMTKGPVAWMMTLIPAVSFGVWKKKRPGIPLKHWLIGSLLFLIVSFGWYVLILLTKDGALDYFLNTQLLGRVLQGKEGRTHPFYYYLIVLPLGFFPWSIFMPSAVKALLKQPEDTADRKDKIHFLLCWFLIPFVLFSLFRTKLATYIVPLMIPPALLAGHFWALIDRGKIAWTRPLRINVWVLSSMYGLLAAGAGIFMTLRPKFVAGIPAPNIFLAAAFLTAASVFHFYLLKTRKNIWIFRAHAAALVLLGLLSFQTLPSVQYKNAKVFAEKIISLRQTGDRTIMLGTYIASLPFYLQERISTVGVQLEKTFEAPEDLEPFVRSDIYSLFNWADESNRIFVLGTKDYYEATQKKSQNRFYPLLSRGKLVLFSDEPEAMPA